MLRLGVSLPALMQLLGHKTIAMTLRYVQVTQQDLQREYHLALQNATQRHFIPKLFPIDSASIYSSGLDGVKRVLGTVCPGVLFPYARCAVSQLVSQGGFPQFLLPPVNFEALYGTQSEAPPAVTN